jgi:hypothetical protein
MAHAFNSDRWLGYAALVCVALVIAVPRSGFLSADLLFVLTASLAVLGLYCGLRGAFLGGWLSRVCAGLSMVFWIWVIYSLMQACRSVRIK